MSIEANKSLIRKYFEAMNAGDLETLAALMAEDCVNHAAIPQAQGREGGLTIARKLRRAFPDLRMTIEDVVAEADRVMCRLVVTGTHDGPLEFVKLPLPATGKSFRVSHIHVFRIANDQIVERWAERDEVGMLRQLGVMPELALPRAEVRS